MPRACLVTGGRGFLGKCLVDLLLQSRQGDGFTWSEIRVMDIAPVLVLSDAEKKNASLTESVTQGRFLYVQGDVRDLQQVISACRGVSTVFHVASPSPESNNFEVQYSVNVIGTKNVIAACKAEGVAVLVYTSSASVVFDGNHDLMGVDETYPYAPKHMSPYGETKAQAEALVLAADGSEGPIGVLRTCALRPSNVFGPGEMVFVPALVRNGAAGRLKFIIGNGKNQTDWTYVENLARAHLLADRALSGGAVAASDGDSAAAAPPDCGPPWGKAYFINNAEPWGFWDFLYAMLAAFGYDIKPAGKLPAALMLPLSQAVAVVTAALRPWGVKPSDFTPTRIKLITRWRTFSPARARHLLGYTPHIPIQEGIRSTAAAYPELHQSVVSAEAERRKAQSPVRMALGGGAVADVLLWRDPHVSASLLILALFAARVFLEDPHPASLAANLAMCLCLLLFSYRYIQSAAARHLSLDLPVVTSAPWRVPPDLVGAAVRAAAWLLELLSPERVLERLSGASFEDAFLLYFQVILALVSFKAWFGHLHLDSIILPCVVGVFAAPPVAEYFVGTT